MQTLRKGKGRRSQKNFFSALTASVWTKREGPWIRHHYGEDILEKLSGPGRVVGRSLTMRLGKSLEL